MKSWGTCDYVVAFVVLLSLLVIGTLLLSRCDSDVMPELTPEPVEVSQQAVEVSGRLGVAAGWGETIQVDDACDPNAWQTWVDFELRQGNEVLDFQAVLNESCKVECGGGEGQCGSPVSPTGWNVADLEPGAYEVWARARWNNVVSGQEVIAHPADLKEQEDLRHFLFLERICVNACYLPVIQR